MKQPHPIATLSATALLAALALAGCGSGSDGVTVEGDVPLALLAFNVGVEAGQVMFIAVVLAAGTVFARLYPKGRRQLLAGSPSLRTVAYAIGILAAFWIFERMAVFVA